MIAVIPNRSDHQLPGLEFFSHCSISDIVNVIVDLIEFIPSKVGNETRLQINTEDVIQPQFVYRHTKQSGDSQKRSLVDDLLLLAHGVQHHLHPQSSSEDVALIAAWPITDRS